MTTRRALIQSFARRRYGTLKQAAAALIEAAGGVERAGETCRLRKSRLSECASPYAETAHLPVDVALALERAAGALPITEYLALAHGCLLLRLPAGDGAGPWARDLARAGKEVADVFGRAAEALADGRVSRTEAPALLREVDEALAAFGEIRMRLALVLDGGEG